MPQSRKRSLPTFSSNPNTVCLSHPSKKLKLRSSPLFRHSVHLNRNRKTNVTTVTPLSSLESNFTYTSDFALKTCSHFWGVCVCAHMCACMIMWICLKPAYMDRASQVGLVVKNLPANAGDVGSIPGSGRSPGEGNGNPLQYSCLENSMDRRT